MLVSFNETNLKTGSVFFRGVCLDVSSNKIYILITLTSFSEKLPSMDDFTLWKENGIKMSYFFFLQQPELFMNRELKKRKNYSPRGALPKDIFRYSLNEAHSCKKKFEEHRTLKFHAFCGVHFFVWRSRVRENLNEFSYLNVCVDTTK